ncbi:hypothetical protein Ancab_021833 [Ancistrocladus abbreviatus]
MGVKTYTQEIESPVAPGRMFKALCLDIDLVPKLMPESFRTIEFLQGDPTSARSIRQLNYAQGIPFEYVRQRIDEVDVNNFYYKYTTFEGGLLGKGYESVVAETKVDAKGAFSVSSGTVLKFNMHFHPLPGTEVSDGDAIVKMTQQKSRMLFKAVEEYLLANPEAFS